jgi:hypothetical protein
MVIIHFLPFATVSVIRSESMPSKLTKTPKEELKAFLTNKGTSMRASTTKELMTYSSSSLGQIWIGSIICFHNFITFRLFVQRSETHARQLVA